MRFYGFCVAVGFSVLQAFVSSGLANLFLDTFVYFRDVSCGVRLVLNSFEWLSNIARKRSFTKASGFVGLFMTDFGVFLGLRRQTFHTSKDSGLGPAAVSTSRRSSLKTIAMAKIISCPSASKQYATIKDQWKFHAP